MMNTIPRQPLDSETWTCAGPCHGQFIGKRPADDTCPQCTVLQATTGPVPLSQTIAAWLPTVLGALDHAEQLMRERAEAFCETCSTSPAEACREHLDQLDTADAYRELARRLGGAR